MDYFTLTPKQYTKVRDFNNRENYKIQLGHYISKQKNIPIEEAREWVEWALENGELRWDDPKVYILTKDDERNRYKTVMKMSQFYKDIQDRDLIMAPTYTCYLPAKTMPSMLSEFTEKKFYLRKKTKKEGHEAKSRGNYELAAMKDTLQQKQKIDINSISGGMTIGSTPLANKSGHSTLTSVCRTATAMANANTERLLMGRRHLWSYESIIDNINMILSYADLERAKYVIEKFGLAYISHEQLYESLKYSWDSYMKSPTTEERVMKFIKTLSPLECTTYLYMGDLYHLRVYNEEWVRKHFDHILGFKDIAPLTVEETKAELKWVDEFFTPLLSMCVSHWIGTLSPFAKDHEDKEYYGYIGAYARYLKDAMGEYADYYDFFWRNQFIPAETAHFPHVHRRAVLGGDTDSTLLTVYQWIEWYCGTLVVNQETKVVAGIFIYYLTMLVKHTLAYVSGVIGIEEKYIHNTKMKNEFYFDVFCPSNRTKHYISLSTVCEGLIQRRPDILVKGVALKNSKAKPEITKDFNKTIVEKMELIAKGEQVDIVELMDHIANHEADIFTSIMHGSVDYLTSRNIKIKEAYKLPMSSDYAHHVLWQEVFADKYGQAPEPPYTGVRISMNLANQTALGAWLDSLEDQEVAQRFRAFVTKYNRNSIASIILPKDVVVTSGIPDELKPIVNSRKIIFGNTEPFYIFLEMFNIGKVNQWLTKLCLDDRLDLLREDLRPYFDPSITLKIQEIRKKAKAFGTHYEEWEEIEEDDEDEDEGE